MSASGTQPRARRGERRIIERPRLIKLLDETEARTILLVAPAGYGKTILLRQWVKTLSGAVPLVVTRLRSCLPSSPRSVAGPATLRRRSAKEKGLGACARDRRRRFAVSPRCRLAPTPAASPTGLHPSAAEKRLGSVAAAVLRASAEGCRSAPSQSAGRYRARRRPRRSTVPGRSAPLPLADGM